MFDIIVTSLDEANNLIKGGWPTRIISLITYDMPHEGPHHLHIKIDDVHSLQEGCQNPTDEHLQSVLDFTKDLTDDDKVLVHCLAGISRSTATAIAICIQHGMTFHDAYHYIKMIRPVMSPNRLITKYTDDHFGLNGQLMQLVKFGKIQ